MLLPGNENGKMFLDLFRLQIFIELNYSLNIQTNSDGFPDKHKVERLVTQDVRDREMKNFLLDSIQECFHIVEMERRRDKCVFSKNIVSCLAERAKANCDDYYNETMIF